MEAIIEKVNLAKSDPNYYHAQSNPELKDLDTYYYLTFDGKGDPESQKFLEAIEHLYAVAYGIKFICKSEDMDFVVPKMEGYWWIDGGLETQHEFTQTPPDQWNWKIVIRMPDFVEGDHYFRAVEKLKIKNKDLTDVEKVKYELINEGLSVQSLHIGSYHEETPTVEAIMDFIHKNGLRVNGYHHEIYLSDPRKTPEKRLRTILRYSVTKK